MTVEVFDDRPCALGEGPLWHPIRKQLFWFDILGQRLLTRDADGPQEWQFDRCVSAAGWVDEDRLLIASDEDLSVFDLRESTSEYVASLEADNPMTRSNDGRADPQGGFWIGTMGHNAEPGAGALYRYHRGEIRKLRANVTIPNATCFTPDGCHAYFADTAKHLVWRYALDADGWPQGAAAVYLDHRATGLNPDGAVVDAQGNFWCAEWGASRVACYDPSGKLVEEVALPVPQPTCPALADGHLYVTTALQGLPDAAKDDAPLSGHTLRVAVAAQGQGEHQVQL
ncbi:SMP-30/gluconolactonase/LRE family protein [Rhodobacteraceae bacterium N5(2021)]|uniref:SMP-30/gluconolactonase/LRE family protein n=1 Tax=Gymnodinialimonas phycosphaerae TaxID=2841589 RepID=A0A975YEK8_9RHOB|nr:SMP-30/gluconolactonase/LRE family protein [Gymnodinialimonas phycosphaerae]MBY4893688.1 SMP-30/gluconolactonase/LRE family protein [Gymnodinialimonas phycosphaerae]